MVMEERIMEILKNQYDEDANTYSIVIISEPLAKHMSMATFAEYIV